LAEALPILVVEDDPSLREALMDTLELSGYTAHAAADGEQALAWMEGGDLDVRPGLVLSDVQMPGMDGLAALELIKTIAPEKSVIIMTGFSTKDTAIHALTARADNYIEKPFDLKTMRAAIEKELQARSGEDRPDQMNVAGKIEHVRWFLEGNCFKKITLQDAAKTVYMSPKYLSRIFREKTGMRFNEYKLKMKIAQAKKILRSTGSSIKQISAKLGYAHTESFIRQFEKIAKTTPSNYRKTQKKRPK